MAEERWKLQKYVTDEGRCTFDEWLNTLDKRTQARIAVRLNRIRLGNFGDCKSVGEGVYELRFFFGPGYRAYYGLVRNQVVLLLAGGSKQRQNKDIRKAQQLWAAYQNEQEGQ